MRAGRLDRRITIQRMVTSFGDSGAPVETWSAISHRRPASRSPIRGDERFQAQQFGAAIAEANEGLNAVLPGFNLSRDSHYQLGNRFAWTWKVAALGVPVILVYLGFLKADEMHDLSQCFADEVDWLGIMHLHAHGIVPDAAWSKTMMIDGTPMRAIIRAAEVPLP